MSHDHDNDDSILCFSRDNRRAARKFRCSDSLRANHERRRDTPDGVFWFSDSRILKEQLQLHQRAATSFISTLPEHVDNSEFANAVPYSIGRHRRWELLDSFAHNDDVTIHESDRRYEMPAQEGSIFHAAAKRERERKVAEHERKLKRKATIEVKGRKGQQTLQLRRPGKRGINFDRQQFNEFIARRRSIFSTSLHLFVFRPAQSIRQRRIAINFAPRSNDVRREQVNSVRRCHERSVLANDARNSFDLRPSEKPLHEGRFERSSKSVRV
jgi:hypothetical protein